jgi:predicted Zn-dependent protease
MRLLRTVKASLSWWNTWHTLPVYSWIRAAQHYRAHQYDKAIVHYLAGLKRHPRHKASQSANIDLAFCLFKTGDLLGAERVLKGVVARAPQCKRAWIRLGDLQLWRSISLEAAWSFKNALVHFPHDAELAGAYLSAVIDHGGPRNLIAHALTVAREIEAQGVSHPRLETALAKLATIQRETQEDNLVLESLALSQAASKECVLAYAESLFEMNEIAHARQQLRRYLEVFGAHPKVYRLLAETYLKSGLFYNPEYAVQVAVNACQCSRWTSPADMHTLADAYYHQGDTDAALLAASKARDCGGHDYTLYRGKDNLEQLIETLLSANSKAAV